MATVEVGSGLDYTTMPAAEQDFDNSGVHTAGQPIVVDVNKDGSPYGYFGDINGGGTLGVSSITIQPRTGSEPTGIADGGPRFQHASTSEISTSIAVTINGMEFDGNGGNCTDSEGLVYITGGNLIVRRCILRDINRTSGSHALVKITNALSGIKMSNCIAYYIRSSASNSSKGNQLVTHALGGAAQGHFVGLSLYNAIQVSGENQARCFRGESGGSQYDYIKNIVAMDGDVSDFENNAGGDTYQDYNCSSDTTAPGTNSLKSKVASSQWLDTGVGTEDLHIVNTSADIYDAGTDTSALVADSEFDAAFYERTTTWSMGALEYQAGGVDYDVSLGEGTKHGDAVPTQMGMSSTVGEGSVGADTGASTAAFLSACAEGTVSGDSVSSTAVFLAAASDGAVHSDTLTSSVITLVSVSFSEGAVAGDSSQSQAAFTSTVPEGSSGSDLLGSVGAFGSSTGDGAKHSDSQSGSVSMDAAIADAGIAGDVIAMLLTINVSVADQSVSGDSFASSATILASIGGGVVAADSVATTGGLPTYTYTLDLPDGTNIVQNAVNVGIRELFNQAGVVASYSVPGVAVINLPVVVLPPDSDDYALGGQYTTKIHHDVLIQTSHLAVVGGPGRGHKIEVDLNGDGSVKTLQVSAPFDSMRLSKHFTRQGTMLRVSTFLESEELA